MPEEPADPAPAEEAAAPSAPIEDVALELIEFARAGNVAECKRLLSESTDVPFLLSFRDDRWSALTWASSEGNLELVTLLLEHGAAESHLQSEEQEETDEPITSPLHWAAYKGHLRIVWLLLVQGLSPSVPDSEQNTALHLAATGGHIAVLKTLLSVGINVIAKNEYGNSALQLTTSAECRELLRVAAKSSQDGRTTLCSCSGEFVSESDSVKSVVVDRVSTPTPRPVRYANHCYAKIQAAEDELQTALAGTNTEALRAAIEAAESIGAAAAPLDTAIQGLQRLEAQIELQTQSGEIEKLRPLSSRGAMKPLLLALKAAREHGVHASLLESADRLVQVVDAEAALIECAAACEPLAMEDDPEVPLGPTVDSPFAARAEAGIAKLSSYIEAAKALEALEDVMQNTEQLHRKLVGESELRRALAIPKEGTMTGEDGESQVPVWTHVSGQTSASLLDSLYVRDEQLESALEKCIAEEVAPGIVAAAQEEQKAHKENLERVQLEDDERKAKEALAAAKAAKKKKGGKKKK